jgi:hypothetical protein
MPTKPYQTELNHLAQCTPKLIKGTGTPNKSHSEITVRFDGANLEMFAQLQKCLEFYCWPTNPNKSGSVKDPAIDGGPQRGKLEGIWRFVDCSPTHAARGEGVYLTLREGYASELVWSEARVPSRALLPQTDNVPIEAVGNTDEDYIDILFPNVDPTKSQTMADALLAMKTVDAPTIWTHKYTGVYHVIYARPREEDDGSHSIIGLLARPRSFLKTYESFESHNATDVYYLHHVPKTIVQSVVDDPLYKTVGASATANYSTERGTYDVIIRTGPDEPVTILNKQTEDGCLTEIYTDWYFGVTKDTVDATSVGSAPQGWIYRITGISPTSNGKFNMRRDRIHGIERIGTGYYNETSSSRESFTVESLNTTNKGTALPGQQGIIQRFLSRLNRFCTWDTRLINTQSTPWEVEFTVPDAPAGVEIHTVKGNQRTIAFPAAEAGYNTALTGWQRNEDGTFNWHLVKTVDQYDTATVEYWIYDIYHRRTLVIAGSGPNAGKYQDQYRRYTWKFESSRHKTEAAAYAWLRESSNYDPRSGVETHGKTSFRAQRRSLQTDYGWVDDGVAYEGE